MKKYRNIRRKFHQLLAGPRRVVREIGSWFDYLRRNMAATWLDWWRIKQFSLLLWGLPALFVVGTSLTLYLAARAGSYDQSKLFSRYKEAAERAIKEERFEDAKLHLERLIQSPSVGHETLFEYAKVAQKVEDFPKMAAALRLLSPDHEAVYPPAHLWQAMQILSQQEFSADDLELARTHLLHTIARRPDDVNANRLLGEICFAKGEYAASVSYLRRILRENPGHNLMTAKAFVELGNSDMAVQHANEGLAYFTEQCSKHPRDITPRLQAAECHLVLGQFKEATDILIPGIVDGDSPELSRALAQTFALWSDAVGASENPDLVLQFELLASGVKADPNEPLLFERILKVLMSGDATAQSAREFLLENVATGRATGLSHLLLGAYSHVSGELEAAQKHLQLAFDSMAQADIAANNLAWLLWQSSNEENRQRALALIDPVVSRNPDEVRYLDTRGHVLMSLGKYQAAIVDLERFITAFPQNSATHGTLAKCYDEIGLPDVAEAHRRQVEAFQPEE